MKQQEIIDNMREHCTNLALCEKFSNVCNELAERINHRLFEDSREFHWILDTPGGLCDFEDTDFLAPDEMVLILEYNISYDQYAEWREANLTHKPTINLRSWLMGLRHEMLKNAPDTPENTSPDNGVSPQAAS